MPIRLKQIKASTHLTQINLELQIQLAKMLIK